MSMVGRPFEKGRAKTGGRPKGKANAATIEFKDTLARILAEPETEVELRALMTSEDSADRSNFWRMAGKFVPTKVEAEVKSEVTMRIIDMSFAREETDGSETEAD